MTPRDEVHLTLEVWPDGSRYRFDRCSYDEATDRLQLTYGPPGAASVHVTPEGHLMRVSVPDNVLCGLVVTEVRARLARDGRISITLGPLQLATLGAADVAELLTRGVPRRTNRFARTGRLELA